MKSDFNKILMLIVLVLYFFVVCGGSKDDRGSIKLLNY